MPATASWVLRPTQSDATRRKNEGADEGEAGE